MSAKLYHHHSPSHFTLPLLLLVSLAAAVCLLQPAHAHGHCSLEGMKKYAIEACEHLFADEAVRERRSLHHNLIADSGYEKLNHNSRLVTRASYPHGGYLRVDHTHYHKLSQLDVRPRYKANKRHFIEAAYYDHLNSASSGDNEGTRYKREHGRHYRNIAYCCLHNCQDDFFC